MARAKDVTNVDGPRFKPTKNKKWAKRYGSHIRVGRRDYQIIFCEVILDENGEQIAGLCDPNDHVLYVDVRREVEATLVHEIVHAEMFEAGFQQRPDWDRGVEEQICEVISQGLSHAFTFRKRT